MDVGDATGTAAGLRFRDLGPLLVELAGEPVNLRGTRLTSALSLLLIHAGRHVGADAVREAMGCRGALPRDVHAVDSHVWRLRKALEPGRGRGEPSRVLLHDPCGFRLVVGPQAVDSARFAHLAGVARDQLAAGRPRAALRTAEEAMALWRGRPYPEVADAPWAAAAVARLEELRGQVRERLVEALLAVGDPERALLELETSLAEAPLREHLWALRMLAQHRLGRPEQALRTYQDARRLLLDELGLDPGPELRAIHARILVQDAGAAGDAPGSPPSPGAVHLPRRLAPLVGREAEVTATAALVRSFPLVTVVGAAGCGKTRLAIEVARTAADAFPDGVWFVDLTGASSTEQVVGAVAAALGCAPGSGGPRDALGSVFADRRLLLLLYGCDSVLDPVADLVEEWAGGAVRVLATSHEPLGPEGEQVRSLAPLSLSAAEGDDASTAPAVALLLDRLAAAGIDRRDLGVRSHAVRIAAAVDGVPLALELAAARARAFSLEEIAHQVGADPSALARIGRGGRHRTVRSAVEQTYGALPAAEAALHRRVCVLPGPFTLAAARALGGPEPEDDTGDLLASLVHRSLLVPLGPSRPGVRRGSRSWRPCAGTPPTPPPRRSPRCANGATRGWSASSPRVPGGAHRWRRPGSTRWTTTWPRCAPPCSTLSWTSRRSAASRSPAGSVPTGTPAAPRSRAVPGRSGPST